MGGPTIFLPLPSRIGFAVGYNIRVMSLPVTIENDAIRMEVYPSIGGKVASVIDKADKFDLLFNYPAELPTGPQYDIPYGDSWYAGWDECFPAVVPSRYVGHPYDGIAVPDHGELWGIPTTAVPTRDGITTVWHGLRFGYRLTRKLFLDGASLQADYTLVNLAPFEFRFVWAMHALMSLASPVQLQPGAPGAFRMSHDADGKDLHDTFSWPNLGELDFSKLETLPTRKGWMMFSADPISAPFTVLYPARGRKVRIEYLSEEDPPQAWWGLWLNTGGWAGNRHFAVEPAIGRFDQLDRCIRDGSAGRIGPQGRREWSVRWDLAAI